MADFLNSSLTGLMAFQRALSTTSHNIANVNTEGYNRQRVDLASVASPLDSTGGAGMGVRVSNISRVLDQFQVAQIRTDVAEQNRLNAFTQMSTQLDSLLANPSTGLSQPLQDFSDSLQTVADSPASLPARQVALGQANALADRLQTLDQRLQAQSSEVNQRLGAAVTEVNSLAESVAALNGSIFAASSGGRIPPNDLLDQRDLVLRQLSELVSIDVVTQEDGQLNVFVGSGQPLVLGNQANEIALTNGPFGAVSRDIGFVTSSGVAKIDIDGGQIGGLMDFQREMLAPGRNVLGAMAVALADTVNAQHRQGMTLQGDLGGEFFAVGAAQLLPRSENTGGGELAVSVVDVQALTMNDYVMTYDGANYSLTRSDTGASVALSGTGTALDPFLAEGLSIVVDTPPAAGDQFMIRPTAEAAAGFALVLSDPENLAAASPVRASSSLSNTGTATSTGVTISNVDDPNLLTSVTIAFSDANTYSVNGIGSFAYAAGTPIVVNGWELTLDGTPTDGDQFVVSENAGGVGDNRNALALAGVLERGVLSGGTASVRNEYGNLVAQTSSVTRRAEINLTAQTAITERAIADQLAISGVNLDEEAANMLRFQQAYQASAQLISVADVLFQTMLSSVRR